METERGIEISELLINCFNAQVTALHQRDLQKTIARNGLLVDLLRKSAIVRDNPSMVL